MTSSCILQIFLWIAIQAQRSVVLSYDKVWDVFRWKQGIRSVFRRIQKIWTLLLSRKGSNFHCLARWKGLEPTAHWSREANVKRSSIFKIAQICCFYRFMVNLYFASAASFAPAIPSCIRYPTIPVCKKCAKMCRVKITPLKQGSDFYAKPGKWAGLARKWHPQFHLFKPSIKCTSTTTIHGRDLDNCDLL